MPPKSAKGKKKTKSKNAPSEAFLGLESFLKPGDAAQMEAICQAIGETNNTKVSPLAYPNLPWLLAYTV